MQGNLQMWKGNLVLCGDAVDQVALHWLGSKGFKEDIGEQNMQQRIQRDHSEKFHITVATAAEMHTIGAKNNSIIDAKRSLEFFDVGAGHVNNSASEAWFVGIFCPEAAILRHKLGLSLKYFHITLGFKFADVHDVEKDLSKINVYNSSVPCLEGMLQLLQTMHLSSWWVTYEKSLIEIMAFNAIPFHHMTIEMLPFIRKLVKYCLKSKYYEVACFLGQLLFERGYMFGLFTLMCCSQEQSSSFDVQPILLQLPCQIQNLKTPLSSETSSIIFKVLSTFNTKLQSQSQEKHSKVMSINASSFQMNLYSLPRNFGWVIADKLAGCAIPTKDEHMAALYGVGINTIITIHEEPLPANLRATAAQFSMSTFHFQVEDRTPPSISHLKEICELINHPKARCLVHCQGGVGRTATAIIAYLMMENMWSVSQATSFVTIKRKILLTHSQTAQLQNWWREVIGDTSDVSYHENSISCESKEELHPVGTGQSGRKKPSVKLPPLLLLCGYAASGKSTFAKSLKKAFPDQIVRVNKDEMRGKGECFEAFSKGVRQGKTVVVDMCNLTAEKRKEWKDMAFNPPTWCINFDIPLAECKYRIKRRQNHPTIPPGSAGMKILASMERQYQPPSRSEGFDQLIVLASEEAVNELLRSWNVDPVIPSLDAETDKLFKFPRTAHAINLGSATRDDKVMLPKDLETFLGSGKHVVIEEKVDGANMGFFINKNGILRAQNRSHFVDSEYHAQFKPLDKWMSQHVGQLWDILEAEQNPERFILYGEWLYATHSVEYTRLPGWFMAFDLYDKKLDRFLPRSVLSEKLQNTNIPQVPLIHEGPVESMNFLRNLVHGPSEYTEGTPREGIVIRLLSDDCCVARAKIVREDFIAGCSERWNRSSQLKTNQLDGYF
mmetsp:Transcript_11846/g.15487  ORF Transcript_11846/g.15487 Transcript_11846/m.15487 type:complete len:892 (+) Transcript_11846:53-2728(+)